MSANLGDRPTPIRIIAFLLCLSVVWLPIAAPIYLLVRNTAGASPFLTMGQMRDRLNGHKPLILG